MNLVGIVLAAGASTRLGRPKQLVEIDGESLLLRTIRIVSAARVSKVAITLGAHYDEIGPALMGKGLTVDRLINPDWREGMASSIRQGITWARSQSATGVLLCVCDQPLLTTEHIDMLIAMHEAALQQNATVGSRYRDVIGVPAVFPSSSFDDLAALTGDRGARALLQTAQWIEWEPGAVDIDTEHDLGRLS
ncbi:MAG TPA: nucleotidyltransferase family protein [Kofleriaceae bacterium]|jgi:CTP:molybdopterin cytidylyltransferase MocA